MIFVPPEFYLFFGLQLPATILLGLLSGVVAVHLGLIRRGRLSLRANGLIVLIAALELAAIAPNPAAWLDLLPTFVLAGAAMALLDLAIRLGLDRHRSVPQFSPRIRRQFFMAISVGLAIWSLAATGFVRSKFLLNPAATSWVATTAAILGLLVVPTLLDATIRVVVAHFRQRRTTEPHL